jgi:hypothetical protein
VFASALSGASVAYQRANSGDYGIFGKSFTEFPYVLSSESPLVDWSGTNEKDPDWIPCDFEDYSPLDFGWSKTDPGKLVFVSNYGSSYYQVWKLVGGTPTQLTFSSSNKSNPAWVDQGDAIVYEDGGNLYKISASGSSPTLVVSGGYNPSGDPNVGPGGSKSGYTPDSGFIYYNGSGSILSYLTTDPNTFSASGFSPTADFDGNYYGYMVYTYDEFEETHGTKLRMFFRGTPTTVDGSINLTGYATQGAVPIVNIDLIGMYEEPDGVF